EVLSLNGEHFILPRYQCQWPKWSGQWWRCQPWPESCATSSTGGAVPSSGALAARKREAAWAEAAAKITSPNKARITARISSSKENPGELAPSVRLRCAVPPDFFDGSCAADCS